MEEDATALEFIRFALGHNPRAQDFASQYDALTRSASARAFRNLGYRELQEAGISFSLLSTEKLQHLIERAQAT